MASSNSKQYGLIINKKFNINDVKRAAVFNNDSDSEDGSAEAGSSDWIKKSFQKQAAAQSGIRRQTEIDMKRAQEQDPTVYQYDEVYDELEKKKVAESTKKTEQKKPRYIQNLLKIAQQRKIENERRVERQVQKEREAEGETYKDKETFVTSAYKKKLEEFHKLDEEERRKDMLEEICDVSKQQDLGGFYRHLYKTTVDKDSDEKKPDDSIKQSCDKENSTKNEKEISTNKEETKKSQRETRQYRKRKTSESSSLEEGEHDGDSDTSISSSSSSSSASLPVKERTKKMKYDKSNDIDTVKSDSRKQNKEDVKIDKNITIKEEKPDDQSISKNNSTSDAENIKNPVKDSSLTTEEKVKPVIKEEKPKISIWVKRTVGPVLEAALERYFKRKAERLAAHGN